MALFSQNQLCVFVCSIDDQNFWFIIDPSENLLLWKVLGNVFKAQLLWQQCCPLKVHFRSNVIVKPCALLEDIKNPRRTIGIPTLSQNIFKSFKSASLFTTHFSPMYQSVPSVMFHKQLILWSSIYNPIEVVLILLAWYPVGFYM